MGIYATNAESVFWLTREFFCFNAKKTFREQIITDMIFVHYVLTIRLCRVIRIDLWQQVGDFIMFTELGYFTFLGWNKNMKKYVRQKNIF